LLRHAQPCHAIAAVRRRQLLALQVEARRQLEVAEAEATYRSRAEQLAAVSLEITS
jgi:hypothetical protein